MLLKEWYLTLLKIQCVLSGVLLCCKMFMVCVSSLIRLVYQHRQDLRMFLSVFHSFYHLPKWENWAEQWPLPVLGNKAAICLPNQSCVTWCKYRHCQSLWCQQLDGNIYITGRFCMVYLQPNHRRQVYNFKALLICWGKQIIPMSQYGFDATTRL